MTDSKTIAQQFLDTLVANDTASYEKILHPAVGLRLWGWRGSESHRPRARVMQRLMNEWAAWPDATLETHTIIAEGNRIAVEFRIQATEHGQYVEHNRSAVLQIKDEQVHVIDLYCAEPVPSLRRKNWIAPADIGETELHQLFAAYHHLNDWRERISASHSGFRSLRYVQTGSGLAHPASNEVEGVRWTAEEADARIAELIEWHRQRHIGFVWFVTPYDTPADLRERLERHGFMLAGDQAVMARVGLDNLDDIPINPQVTVEVVDGTNDDVIEASLQITGRCFNLTKEQIDHWRPSMFERRKDSAINTWDVNYLAHWLGKPVATARVVYRAGVAYLGGAATLPEYRNQKVYSTLLRYRLADARARGYHISFIHAEPMSRRVVARYGFKEYARFHLYGWMPEMDAEVIKAIVPDE
jgi:GNAT superfamily N-acetyltransferase